ncbi:uncharacterized protein LOC129772279 [Toxorhynchites rutilus septentrionalis]|uniref:uncharacterized protein LOC129772279 n=1 Tax=Toxorhynchites rutilus septentrionalis TaxID=329112 RepID=UPI00247A6E06|nr:uncharacterized protein LOC129772279 [Toxorhynchites rutilus septentrionalis]
MHFSAIYLVFYLIFQYQEIACGKKSNPDKPECVPVQRFVAAYTSFLKQIPWHIFPVNTFCTDELCVYDYDKASYWFHNATSDELCKAQNFNHNRLNVVQTLHDQMELIWGGAHCQNCVDHKNETDNFFTLVQALDECIMFNSAQPCEPCAENYTHVQDYYKEITTVSKGEICFDIEDRMNHTRYSWSAVYKCCKDKQHSTKAFIGFATAICSLPVIFYTMMYFITMRKESRAQAAMAPLMDDQPDEEDVAGDPQPGCSSDGLVSEPDLFHDDVSIANNLDQTGVKEGQFIALDRDQLVDTEMNITEEHPADGDDVSMLQIRVDNLLN